MGKPTDQPKRQVPRDAKGRFVKRAKPLSADVLRQLGFGLVQVGDVRIPVKRAVLADWLDDSVPWKVVDLVKEKG